MLDWPTVTMIVAIVAITSITGMNNAKKRHERNVEMTYVEKGCTKRPFGADGGLHWYCPILEGTDVFVENIE